MFNRGHELTTDTYTDRKMSNKFQGNMADICPVGAITEKEFHFKRRVWKLKKIAPSVPDVLPAVTSQLSMTEMKFSVVTL